MSRNAYTTIDLALRERIENLSKLRKTSIGWTVIPNNYSWIKYPSGLYGKQGYLEPILINPFGNKRTQHMADCEKAAKLFSKNLETIASDCRNPKVTKITWRPTQALETTVMNWLSRDLWTFAYALQISFDIQMGLRVELLKNIPKSTFDNFPQLSANFDPWNGPQLTGYQILSRLSIKRR